MGSEIMRDEVKRICKLVAEGKLSPEDAAEMIAAFENGQHPSSVSAQRERGPL